MAVVAAMFGTVVTMWQSRRLDRVGLLLISVQACSADAAVISAEAVVISVNVGAVDILAVAAAMSVTVQTMRQ